MSKFGIEEIHAIRAQWAEMPEKEYKAEQKRLLSSAMKHMYGDNWEAAYAARMMKPLRAPHEYTQ